MATVLSSAEDGRGIQSHRQTFTRGRAGRGQLGASNDTHGRVQCALGCKLSPRIPGWGSPRCGKAVFRCPLGESGRDSETSRGETVSHWMARAGRVAPDGTPETGRPAGPAGRPIGGPTSGLLRPVVGGDEGLPGVVESSVAQSQQFLESRTLHLRELGAVPGEFGAHQTFDAIQ